MTWKEKHATQYCLWTSSGESQFLTGKRDVLAAKCIEGTLKVQCMSFLAEDAESLPARVAEQEKESNTMESTV